MANCFIYILFFRIWNKSKIFILSTAPEDVSESSRDLTNLAWRRSSFQRSLWTDYSSRSRRLRWQQWSLNQHLLYPWSQHTSRIRRNWKQHETTKPLSSAQTSERLQRCYNVVQSAVLFLFRPFFHSSYFSNYFICLTQSQYYNQIIIQLQLVSNLFSLFVYFFSCPFSKLFK